jgi:hypothetical protein
MARGIFGSREVKIWRGSLGSFRMDTLLYCNKEAMLSIFKDLLKKLYIRMG